MSHSEQIEVRVAHTNIFGDIVDITKGVANREVLVNWLEAGICNAQRDDKRPGEKIPVLAHQRYAPSFDKLAVLHAIIENRKSQS